MTYVNHVIFLFLGGFLVAPTEGPRFENFPSVTHLDEPLIAVPTEVHRTVAEPLLRRGIAVLVEKPLGVDIEECEELSRRQAETELVVQVGPLPSPR